MRKIMISFTVLLGTVFYLCGGCSNPGIEVGNPDLSGKIITLKVQNDSSLYSLRFMENDTTDVSQIKGNQVETVSSPYTYVFPTVNVKASFTDRTQIDVTLTLNSAGEFTDVAFLLNGQPTTTSIQSQLNMMDHSSPSTNTTPCATLTSNGAITIAQTLCSHIVSCWGNVTCGECETSVLNLANLGHQFGGNPNETLQQTSEEIDQGMWNVDETALSQCLEEIPLIDCSQVEQAVTGNPPSDYSHLHLMIPKPSCATGILKVNP
jgi:hypothetical protein